MNKNSICSTVGLVGSSFLLQPVMAQAQKAPVESGDRPNIVIIVADDLGWGDVGFHQSSIKTPNLDRVAKQGIILDRFYTAPVSSPTRASVRRLFLLGANMDWTKPKRRLPMFLAMLVMNTGRLLANGISVMGVKLIIL